VDMGDIDIQPSHRRRLVRGGEAVLAIGMVLVMVGLLELGPGSGGSSGSSGSAASGPGADGSGPTGSRAAATRVMVIGDSLIAGSSAENVDELTARGYDPTVAANPGRPLSDPWTQSKVTEAAKDPTIAIVVLATAANDNIRNFDGAKLGGDAQALAVYRQLLRSTMAQLQGRCIVLVDARDVRALYYRSDYAPKTNDSLRQVAATRPGTEVVAWSTTSRPHTDDWFISDMEHFPVPELHQPRPGAEAYARAIADGVDRCAGLLEPTVTEAPSSPPA